MFPSRPKFPSRKAMDWLNYFVRAALCLAIGANGFILWKTGHLSGIVFFLGGFNTATLIWNEIMTKARKAHEELFDLFVQQQRLIGKLFLALDRGDSRIPASDPVDPERN